MMGKRKNLLNKIRIFYIVLQNVYYYYSMIKKKKKIIVENITLAPSCI